MKPTLPSRPYLAALCPVLMVMPEHALGSGTCRTCRLGLQRGAWKVLSRPAWPACFSGRVSRPGKEEMSDGVELGLGSLRCWR